MAEVGVYYVTIMPDMSGFSSNILKELELAAGTEEAGRQAGNGFMSGFGSMIMNAGAVFIGNLASQAASAMMSGVGDGIQRLDTLTIFPKVMSNMGIDAESSAAAIERVRESIIGLPTSLDDAARAVQRLTMSTGDIDRASEVFIAFNNALVAGAAPASLQASALEQFSQAVNKGKPDMLEWRSLMNAMPAQLNQVAMKMGLSAAELGEGLRQGSIPMDDFLDAIVELNTEGVGEFASFSEQVTAATSTIGVAMTNVRNRISQFWEEILGGIGQERISGIINDFSSNLPGWGAAIGEFVSTALGEFDRLNEIYGITEGIEEAWDDLVGHLDVQELSSRMANSIGFWSFAIGSAIDVGLSGLSWLVEKWDELNEPFNSKWYRNESWYGGEWQAEDGRTFIRVLSEDQQQSLATWSGAVDESWKYVQDVVHTKTWEINSDISDMNDAYKQAAAITDESWKQVQGDMSSLVSKVISSNNTMSTSTIGLASVIREKWAGISSSITSSITSAVSTVASAAASIQQSINSINGKKVNVDVNIRKTGISTISMDGTLVGGGISIWARAAGGIVTAPQINLVGESGAEAIVPLTNQAYVRPFARAVANEMGGRGSVYVNAREINSNAAIRRNAERLAYASLRKAGML